MRNLAADLRFPPPARPHCGRSCTRLRLSSPNADIDTAAIGDAFRAAGRVRCQWFSAVRMTEQNLIGMDCADWKRET